MIALLLFSETVSAGHYKQLILELISILEAEEKDCWFQQTKATAHTAISTMQILQEFFEN
jgi:hypothetical protein